MTTTGDSNRAALVVRAHDILKFLGDGHSVYGGKRHGELRDILRDWIASFPPEKADAALAELFAEIDILGDVIFESCYDPPNPDKECPFW
jgi:hypothetical protein